MITINLFGLDLEISWSSIILVLLVTKMTSGYMDKADAWLLKRKRFAIQSTVLLIFFSLFVHELLHGLLANLFGYEVDRAMIWALGAGVYIQTPLDEMVFAEALIILLAGPMSNLLLAFYFRYMAKMHYDNWHYPYKFLALINMSLFYINILPIFPLDGGRVIYRIFLQYFNEPTAFFVSTALAVFVILIIAVFGSGQKQLMNKFLPDSNF